ncbi:MAG: hypothetical protein ACYS76_12595 [Planctomycetota bacterium]|jgi:hypothetical protein
MVKKTADEYFKETKDGIEKVCFMCSVYYALNYNDLISLSNESFMKSYQNYKYDKVEFEKFMLFNLVNDIKRYFRYEQIREMKERQYLSLKKCEFLVKNESFYTKKHIKTRKNEPFYIKKYEKKEINVKKDIKNLIDKIIDLCLLPNIHDLLKPFYKNSIYKNKRIPAYAIKKYFMEKENYTFTQVDKAFSSIKFMLREGLI